MMAMIPRIGTKRIDLDELTEDQWADLDRLVMILWGTKPLIGVIAVDEPSGEVSTVNELLCANGW